MASLLLEPSRAVLALRHSGIPSLRRLSIEETDTSVTITGAVPTYYMKQLAQETVRRALAGRRLHNRVTVVQALAQELVQEMVQEMVQAPA